MKKVGAAILGLVLALNLGVRASAISAAALETAYKGAAEYCVDTTDALAYGGEWLALGLCRGGAGMPDGWPAGYYRSVADTVQERGGVLSDRKYTEYSRVIVGLTAAGFDAADVGGHDLTLPLGDYGMTVRQGLNGPIWALIALDSGRYETPVCAAGTQATREMYVAYILTQELGGGGWALGDAPADPDMTAMALCALAKYGALDGVAPVVERAVTVLSSLQNGDGGFSSWTTENAESCAQVVVALCELGISPDDARFVKNGSSPLDNLLTYQLPDGSFEHVRGGGGTGAATEQALYALAAAKRAAGGKVSLYRMATFTDIQGHRDQNEIETLANAEILNGMGGGLFAPDKTMSRAEFCAVVVKALGLKPKTTSLFADVAEDAWYAGYVGAAYEAGVVKGTAPAAFAPDGLITDVEAHIMLSRAAVLLGLQDEADESWHGSERYITRCEVAAEICRLKIYRV